MLESWSSGGTLCRTCTINGTLLKNLPQGVQLLISRAMYDTNGNNTSHSFNSYFISDSNVGAIVGGVIGALLAVCLIGAIAFIIIKKPFSRGVRRNPKASYGVKWNECIA